jgi:hypothetical protein
MLSDDELAALRDIERRLRWTSPELVSLFNSVATAPAKDHPRRARTRVLLAAGALTGLALLGPRMLNDAEVRTQRRRPLPCTAPATNPIAGRTEPASGPDASAGPVAVVDIFLAPSTTATTPSRHDRCAEDTPGRLLDWETGLVEWRCREA